MSRVEAIDTRGDKRRSGTRAQRHVRAESFLHPCRERQPFFNIPTLQHALAEPPGPVPPALRPSIACGGRVADLAADTSMPAGWKGAVDAKGREYYYHPSSGQLPCLPCLPFLHFIMSSSFVRRGASAVDPPGRLALPPTDRPQPAPRR